MFLTRIVVSEKFKCKEKYMSKSFRLILFVMAMSFAQTNLHAGMSLSGSVMQTKRAHYRTDNGFNLENSKLTATETMEITGAGALNGDAKTILTSPEITIITKTFNFKGTINCSNNCTIIVKEDFDRSMFKQIGGGAFTITVDPDHEVFQEVVEEEEKEGKAAQEKPIVEEENGEGEKPKLLETPKEINLEKLELSMTVHKTIYHELIQAIENDDLEEFKKIIQNNPQISDSTNDLIGCLLIAGEYEKTDFIKTLIDQVGVNFKTLNHEYKQTFLVDLELLYRAINANNLILLKGLLDAGLDPNGKQELYGSNWHNRTKTPLHFAIEKNNLEAVLLLLDSPNINVNIAVHSETSGETALMHAAYFGHKKIVEALLKAGARTHQQNNHHATALDYAKDQNQVEIIELLNDYEMESWKKEHPDKESVDQEEVVS
jgi:hypothetical protein